MSGTRSSDRGRVLVDGFPLATEDRIISENGRIGRISPS